MKDANEVVFYQTAVRFWTVRKSVSIKVTA